MYNINYFLSFYMFTVSCVMLILFFDYLLMILISLEFLMVSLMFNMFNMLINMEINLIYMFFFLVMVVCEGALGVSLLVLMVRVYGNDYMNSLSFIKW